MELLFESRTDMLWTTDKVNVVQGRAEIDAEPVLVGDTFADRRGVSIYGTVLRDGGRFRMWYQATAEDYAAGNPAWVAYAESDDGLTWRKPDLGLVSCGPGANNLCDLNVHCPSVFIDPDAPASGRYRAAGYVSDVQPGCRTDLARAGYYTFGSPDGLHWEPDGAEPTWDSCDVITSAYHPDQRRGIAAMKFNPRVGGFMRRVLYTAELRDGRWSPARPALIPDEFDDICAVARGYVSGDYYGMSLLPAGSGTVGLIWQFRHRAPRTSQHASGQFGESDVTLAYQSEPGGCWQHSRGRADFISHTDRPWTRGGVYGASTPIEVGDEHWLYISGSVHSHAWQTGVDGEPDPVRQRQMAEEGHGQIGIARWPKWRLVDFRADPAGMVTVRIGPIDGRGDLHLNYECEPGGWIDASLIPEGGGSVLDTATRLTGDAVEAKVNWKQGALAATPADRTLWLQLQMDRASVYAYDLR